MTHYAIDYFATLGKPDGPCNCKSFPIAVNEGDPPIHGKELWGEAITDIILIGSEEEIPEDESWILNSETVNGAKLEFPWIAFRKRMNSKNLDHICELKTVNVTENHPPNLEVIKTTTSGKNVGFVKGLGYVAFKRSAYGPSALLHGDQIIYDLCVIKKSLKEDIPDHYVVIDRDTVGLAGLSTDLSLCVRYMPAMGICDLAYEAATLDRFPLKDYKGLPLPAEALPIFAFPRHLRLQVSPKNQYPLPIFYTFVFTDQDGRHMYAACLKFFEAVALKDLEGVIQSVYGENQDVQLPDDVGIFAPKVVCLLAHRPFYRAMRRYLRHIYSLSLSSLVCPLEHFITAVVNQVPLPVEGGRPFHVVLDSALISITSRPMKPVIFELPSKQYFPVMDLDFAGPLRCLSVDHMLAVFTLMLRESKILFLSTSNTLLTETMETLRSLLFPLLWSSCFVTRLPTALSGLLQAPGGFMIGLHVDINEYFPTAMNVAANNPAANNPMDMEDPDMGNNATNNASIALQQQLLRKMISHLHHDYPVLPGSYVVDLSSNMLYQYNGKQMELLGNTYLDGILKTLPTNPKMRLKAKLMKIVDEYSIGPQMTGLEEFDSAFDFQHSSEESELLQVKWELFPTMIIRDSFMSFMIDLLGDYPRYIIPPAGDLAMDTYRTFQEEFAVHDYLSTCQEVSCRPLLESLMETQMFSVLLQQRSENTSDYIVYFEAAAQLQREIGLSCGGHGYTMTTNQMMSNGTISGNTTSMSSSHVSSSNGGGLTPGAAPLVKATSVFAAMAGGGSGNSSGNSNTAANTTPTSSTTQSSVVTELPVPLFLLLEYEKKWCCLNASLQQQILHQINNTTTTSLSGGDPTTSLGDSTSTSTSTSSTTISPLKGGKRQYMINHIAQGNTTLRITTANPNAFYYSSHHIYNQKLLDLLAFLDFITNFQTSKLITSTVASNQNDGLHQQHTSVSYQAARQELDRQEELHLHDRSYGPLILPGPKKIPCATEIFADDEQVTLYSYPTGWPKLHNEYLEQLSQITHPRMATLSEERHYALKQLNPLMRLLVRSPTDRMASEYLGKLQHSSRHTTRISPELRPAISAVLGIASISITMLTLRCLHGVKPIDDLLQILGIIAQLESWGISDYLPENVWCSILVICEHIGGNVMRRTAMMVHEMMKLYALFPNALTYAQYVKAYNATIVKVKSAHSSGEYLDAFLYLEEIGFTWYIQKLAIFDQEKAYATTSTTNNSGSNSPMKQQQQQQRSVQSTKQSWFIKQQELYAFSSEAIKSITKQLILVPSNGMIPFLSPRQLTGYSLPKDIHTVEYKEHITDIQEELQLRTHHVYEASKPIARVDTASMTSASSSSGNSSPIPSKASNQNRNFLQRFTPDRRNTTTNTTNNTGNNNNTAAAAGSGRSPMNLMSNIGKNFFRRPTTQTQSTATATGTAGAEPSPTVTDVTPTTAATSTATSTTSATSSTTPIKKTTWASRLGLGGIGRSSAPSSPVPPSKPMHQDTTTSTTTATVSGSQLTTPIVHNPPDFEEEEEDHSSSSSSSGGSSSGGSRDEVEQATTTIKLMKPTRLDDIHVEESSNSNNTAAMDRLRLSHPLETRVSGEGHDVHQMEEEEQSEEDGEANETNEDEGGNDNNNNNEDKDEEDDDEEEEENEKKRLNISLLQDRLLSTITKEYTLHHKGIGISSQTPCANCGYVLMDEEILTQWCQLTSIDIHQKASANAHQVVNFTRYEAAIECPECSESILPQLHVYCYELTTKAIQSREEELHLESVKKTQYPPNELLSIVWDEHVMYLNPFSLQYELEELLLQEGEKKITDIFYLHSQYPAIYWNILWYTQRCHLPSGFFFPPSSTTTDHHHHHHHHPHHHPVYTHPSHAEFHATSEHTAFTSSEHHPTLALPVFISWEQKCHQSKLLRVLYYQKAGNYVDIQDLYPDFTVSEYELITKDILSCLDHSPVGLRDAIMAIRKCDKLFHTAKTAKKANWRKSLIARQVYIHLYYLSTFYGNYPLYDHNKTGLIRDIEKETEFDKMFLECVKCVLSKKDLEELQTDEFSLINAVTKHSGSIAIRAIFGVLA